MERHVVSGDGTPIACFLDGTGPALVMVHGMTFDHATAWFRLAPLLSDRFELCTIDRRGRGASGDGPAYSFELEVDDVLSVAKSSDGPVALFAHSFGATIAMEAAPLLGNLGALILYEPSISSFDPWPKGSIRKMEQLLAAGERAELLRCFFCEVMGMDSRTFGALRAMPSWQARIESAHTIPREARADDEYIFDPGRLAGLGVPTLVIAGSESPVGFGPAAQAVHEAIPASRLTVLDGHGHDAALTAPAVLAETIQEFMATLE